MSCVLSADCDLPGTEEYRARDELSEKYLVPGTYVQPRGNGSGSLEFLFRKKSGMEPHTM